MGIATEAYEKLGQFYLGRGYDPATRQADGDPLLYDSKDLVTHGVVLGMTGSGKTGLCMAILEEAAMDGVPAIVIDPKGDIANLMLLFPELNTASFRPWINDADAARKGVTAEQHAENTAAGWKQGLEDWGQGPERIATLREKVDVNIFTPGSKAGIPVSILSSLAVPPFEIIDDSELLGENIQTTVMSLLSLIGLNVDPIQSTEAVLLSRVFQHSWEAGEDITLETLIRHIQQPAFDKVGVIDVESFMPEKVRQELAMKFNNLLASPGFQTWLEGPPLDIAKMLHAPDGKPRVSIFSIAHLGDAERMFFVTLLLNQMLGWMRAQNGTTSLRALLYMDEIFGFLPPTANPPSKRPMITLLKQGRAFGLGCLLATQNPVDLDYKALSNIGTWFLGRLQTERDKLRVLEGLDGIAGSQTWDRSEVGKLLSQLDSRVFLMHNVHEDHPVLFSVRWVMSYLTGPLTRGQIKILMDPKRVEFESHAAPASARSGNPMSLPGGPSSASSVVSRAGRPVVGSGVREWFVPPVSHAEEVIYQPHLLREGMIHFSLSKAGFDETRKVRMVNPITESGIDWENPQPPPGRIDDSPPDGDIRFGELPGFAMNRANYQQVEKEFSEWMYRNERAEVWICTPLKAWSRAGETEGDFRVRLAHESREKRDAAIEKLRASVEKRLVVLQNRLQSAEAQRDRQKTEATAAKVQAGMSVLGGILGSLMGRKGGAGRLRGGAAAVGRAGSAYKQHQDVAHADAKVAGVMNEIEAAREALELEVSKLRESFEPSALEVTAQEVRPTRKDVKVERVALLWLPFDDHGNRAW